MENKLYNPKEHFYCLDGLKGIGALLIACVWHYQHFGPKEGSPFFVIFRPFYEQVDLLVELFFVISGFLIALRYSKEIESHSIIYKQYIIKRLKKLVPTMLFCHFLTFILQSLYWVKTGSFFQYPNFDF